MFWNNNCSIFRNITSCFLSSFLYYEATKSTKVNILIFRQRIFYCVHKRFNSCQYCYFVNSGVLCNFVYNICFSHFSLKKILLLCSF